MIRWILFIALWLCQGAFFAVASSQPTVEQVNKGFVEYYHQQLGSPQSCIAREKHVVKACSSVLRNEGNSPYILHHGEVTDQVVVLFHGLSDSPFYLRSIADSLHQIGITVVVGLLPGHGLKSADADMQDPTLSDRWISAVDQVIKITRPLGRKLMVGGFSAGGALTTHYAMRNSDKVNGLILLSGALVLSDNAERMSRIWGMQFITRWVDGDYQTFGPNPYKYPGVALFSVLELFEVLHKVRSLRDTQALTVPTFAAHSLSDVTTPYAGIESLLEGSSAAHSMFLIDESYELCHGDLPLNKQQVVDIDYVAPVDEFIELCVVPKANPLHQQMITMLQNFVASANARP